MASKEQNAALAEFAVLAVECEKKYDMPAELSCAQWILESSYGAKRSGKNNAFGIKKASRHKSSEWCLTTEAYRTPQDLQQAVSSGNIRNPKIIRNGPPIDVACEAEFASFDSMQAAMDDRAILISTAPVYAKAWATWKKTRSLPDFVKQLAAVYATAPDYAALVLQIARQDNVTNAIARLR